VFWAVTEGVVAGTLLVGGGLVALQTAAITTGLPFAVVLLFMCVAVHRGMQRYIERYPQAVERPIEPRPPRPERKKRRRPGHRPDADAPKGSE
jgi:choline/glycine/proline betaine transport protein